MTKPTNPNVQRAVIYARVSSKEQEQGFSIPAQLKLLRAYAADQGFTVAQEYVDVETAKRTGRTGLHNHGGLLQGAGDRQAACPRLPRAPR